MDRNMEKVSSFGLINLHMRVNLLVIIYMDLEHMFGRMIEHIQVNGVIIKCMERESLDGVMTDNTMDMLKNIILFIQLVH